MKRQNKNRKNNNRNTMKNLKIWSMMMLTAT